MAINFPTSLDNFTNPSSGNTLDSPSHSLQHSNINDAVEALEAKLGIGASPAGSATSGQVLTASTGGTTTWTTPTVPGLVQIVPASVAVGSGSGSVSATGTVTFSGASSVSLNGAFTTAYQNYRIVINTTAASAAAARLKLRANGTDTSSNYQTVCLSQAYQASVSWGMYSGSASDSNHVLGPVQTSEVHMVMDIFSPQTATVSGIHSSFDSVGGGFYLGNCAQNSTTQFDGFTIYSATYTGTIRVYGYNQ